ncbi:DegT/DnrJ/EryC1/StrS family aminotransferase [Bacillus licheniformis]|nr:DegT/DnrJ/EryC1/StrS family aminotransferase [Bacillus licheniformis]
MLTTGEGGAITTDREELKDWLSVKLNHGAAISDGNWIYRFRLQLQIIRYPSRSWN